MKLMQSRYVLATLESNYQFVSANWWHGVNFSLLFISFILIWAIRGIALLIWWNPSSYRIVCLLILAVASPKLIDFPFSTLFPKEWVLGKLRHVICCLSGVHLQAFDLITDDLVFWKEKKNNSCERLILTCRFKQTN